MQFQPYAKAITAAVVTGLGTLQVAYVDNVISTQEWINVAIATLVALGGVWAVPNVTKAAASWGTLMAPGSFLGLPVKTLQEPENKAKPVTTILDIPDQQKPDGTTPQETT